jgi:hypothetical protein
MELKNRRIYFMLVVFLILLPIAYSEVRVTNVKSSYNLGENLILGTEVKLERDFNGYEKARIECTDLKSTFYTSPITLRKDELIAADLTPLPIMTQMKGICSVIVSFETVDGSVIEESAGQSFEVSDLLIAELDAVPDTYNPGDNFQIKGVLLNSRQEPISGMLKVNLDNKNYNFYIEGSRFDLSIKLPDSISSGDNKIVLNFQDNKGNFIEKSSTIKIIPKQTGVLIQLNQESYLPYETLNGVVSVVDQAGRVIEGIDLVVKIFKDSKEIYTINQKSGAFNYFLDNSLAPRNYTMLVTTGSVEAKKDFEVKALSKISIVLQNQTLIIRNDGNVAYDNTEQIILSDSSNRIVLDKNVDLKPNETKGIDLSKEVPEGSYTIGLPNGESLENVSIDDNRGIIKKITGANGITGNSVKNVGFGIGTAVVVLILLGLIALFLVSVMGYDVLPWNKKEDGKAVEDEEFAQEEAAKQAIAQMDFKHKEPEKISEDDPALLKQKIKVLEKKVTDLEAEKKLLNGKLYAYRVTQKEKY